MPHFEVVHGGQRSDPLPTSIASAAERPECAHSGHRSPLAPFLNADVRSEGVHCANTGTGRRRSASLEAERTGMHVHIDYWLSL